MKTILVIVKNELEFNTIQKLLSNLDLILIQSNKQEAIKKITNNTFSCIILIDFDLSLLKSIVLLDNIPVIVVVDNDDVISETIYEGASNCFNKNKLNNVQELFIKCIEKSLCEKEAQSTQSQYLKNIHEKVKNIGIKSVG